MNWLAEVNQVEWELKGLKSTMAALGHGYVDVYGERCSMTASSSGLK
eukprot:CAMPEP_0182531000 /NCGR_PEP_ID=MMETSP1323-20130603/7491_1 /TAXON_ID=236787 /ORGANISM="Florenciella parvula, Strain RCC1693" /LENGTH=46 /DNA_ID= /DNA_START= /DNA_END= /DNA_ORIENTATION=